MKLLLLLTLAFLALVVSSPAQDLTFTSNFDSGNGHLFTQTATNTYSFQIEPDSNSTDRQWFYFQVNGAAGRTITFRLLNTNTHNVPSHWNGARPVYSRDGGQTWQHVGGSTSHSSSVFTFSHSFIQDSERIAFHYPYTFNRFVAKINEWGAHPDVTRTIIGRSVLNRPIVLFRVTDESIGTDATKRGFWIIARQHAAEVTGSYSAEGFMDFLLSDEPEALALRHNAVVHVVPMVNPDGAFLGNYRDNQAGINLNRVWNGTANTTTSPEVFLVQGALDAWVADGNPYDMFIDFHSTSGQGPHFAFHANSAQQPPLYHNPPSYHADSRAFLALVNNHAPHFNPTAGASGSTDQSLSYHRQRIQYGVLAFIPEGTYNLVSLGPDSTQYQTPTKHREVGEGFAKALAQYYKLEPVVPTQVDSWRVH